MVDEAGGIDNLVEKETISGVTYIYYWITIGINHALIIVKLNIISRQTTYGTSRFHA